MASVPFHYVDLRAFCYATEDEKRVERALRTYLPDRGAGEESAGDGGEDAGGGEPIELDRAETEGFHGDRILVLSVRLDRADEVRHVLSRLAESPDLDAVLDELDERIDEDCTFFLSLDKQAAVRGEVARGDGITLRGKVEAYPARKPAAVENVRETLTGLVAGEEP